LGPILERVVEATGGQVELVTVDVDQNPQVSASFQVQSIPAVYALKDGKVVDGFVGALPEAQVAAFINGLAPAPTETDLLVAAGDEPSLRKALELEPGHPGAVLALARLVLDRGDAAEALELLGRVPETAEVRALAAEARLAEEHVDPHADVAGQLDELLDRVRDDEAARQRFLDLLETLGPEDPRTTTYRKALASRLF
jgi:putative thioredoxin